MNHSLEVSALTSNPEFWILCAWLVRELLRSYQDRNKSSNSALKENSDKITELTICMAKFEAKLESIVDRLDSQRT